MRRKILNVLFLFLCVLVVLFSISNQEKISVFFWPIPFEITLPIFLLASLFFIVGFFCGWVYSSIRALKLRKILSTRLKEEIEHLKMQNKIMEEKRESDSSKIEKPV